MLQAFNTLSGKKEPLPDHDPLRLFVCGPTVYDHAHIGHARTYIAFDAIVRYLRARGREVTYLQNITDIDDKIIDRAAQQKTAWKKLVRELERSYHQNMKQLGVTSVSMYARATDFIPDIVKQVQTLIDTGHAYEIPDDGWYFDLSTFPSYGKLSRRTAAQASDGVSRIDTSTNKKNPGDFCLWKYSKPGEPKWKTPLGTGRPGWHIEDTAISEHFFGPQYDLHGGAADLKFPHHEAEIAQQESASGKEPFVRIWMHTGFLLVNGEKMSKSLGNFITINDFLAHHASETLRMLVLSHHYRSPIDYSEAAAAQAASSLAHLRHTLARLALKRKKGSAGNEVTNMLKTAEEKFTAAMDDDFNTPDALGALFSLLNAVEPQMWTMSAADAKAISDLLVEKLGILGLGLKKKPRVPAAIMKKAKERESLRSHKQFIQADALREELDTVGYIIEDTLLGPLVLPKE
ncbi:cysteine--tRNA ligase [Patescibacteria group bacterium]|nr:cysteine--tRNA ligase [Patescibacteria group bacterium]